MSLGRYWEGRGHGRGRRAFIRFVTVAALAVVLAVLVLQVAGVGDTNDNVNGFTVSLLLMVIVLGFAVAAPTAVKEVLDRVTTFKFGGVELGLQAAERLDLLQTPLAGDDDALTPRDDVRPSEVRPRGGGAVREFVAVQEKLKDRLRYVRDVVLMLDKELAEKLTEVQVVEKVDEQGLVGHLELRVLYDLLGRAEQGIERLPEGDRDRYLNRAWRFATRLGTLIFEREARKQLIDRGWFLLDFEQSRKHRPDFLAYKQTRSQSKGEGPTTGSWLLIATRVEPGQATETIERLQGERPPFNARRVVVVPDRRGKRIPEVPGVEKVDDRQAMRIQSPAGKAWMLTLGALLEYPAEGTL